MAKISTSGSSRDAQPNYEMNRFTDAQCLILHNFALANPTIVTLVDPGTPGYDPLHIFYEGQWLAPWEPAKYLWHNEINEEDLVAIGFDWTLVDNLSVGKARIWEWLLGQDRILKPSKLSIRLGLAECWKGTTAAMAAQREAIFNTCKRRASVLEHALGFEGTFEEPFPDPVDLPMGNSVMCNIWFGWWRN